MALRNVRLHLAFHHHQPFGNLPGVLEDCCRRGYLPLLRALEEAEPLKFNLSYSGPLLLFLAGNFPEYMETLQRMVKAGRVEILSTGFYEPILGDLEEDDRQGQLKLTRDWWEKRGVKPRGLWLSEGVWESDLPRTMVGAGLDYTVISRERLLQGGVPAGRINGHLLTEYQGDCCRLFPNEEQLLRLAPFGGIDELFALLRRAANRGDIVLTCADQAERWAIWPGSRERVLDSGYLRQLLQRFREQSEWVRLALFSETLGATNPSGKCYPPPGVSKELGVWSLPDETRTAFQQARQNLETRFDADQFLPYFRVGSWAGFRSRYVESNLMQKKGLWLKRRIPAGHPHIGEIRRCLHEAQCNTAYWYGTSGGIYAPHLREAVWRSLLRAQALCNQGLSPRVDTVDADADGKTEILLESCEAGLMWSPARGGALIEWSHLPSGTNLCNTMTRYRETPPPSSDAVDPWTRHAFQDLFFKKHTTVEELASGRHQELGDFAGNAFEGSHRTEANGAITVVLERSGVVLVPTPVPLRLRKTFQWHPERPAELQVAYEVENRGKLPVQAIMGIQINLALPGGDGQMGFEVDGRKHPAEIPWFEGLARSWSAHSNPETPGIQLVADQPLALWSYPVFSAAGEGVLAIRQGNAVVSGILLNLAPGESMTLNLQTRLAVA